MLITLVEAIADDHLSSYIYDQLFRRSFFATLFSRNTCCIRTT
jgi:hypothetical protein